MKFFHNTGGVLSGLSSLERLHLKNNPLSAEEKERIRGALPLAGVNL